MSTYAIGDIQGCFVALEQLLKKIQFDRTHDVLWFTGDLVNRGPQSLETLRFIKNLGAQQRTVLGNHDLHLLAIAYGYHPGRQDDTLTPILEAPDRDELIEWLAHQPLIHHDATLNFTMVHAGLAPAWDLATALRLAQEVETLLQHNQRQALLQNLYGNEPATWNEQLTGWDRIRCIINFFTRIRFCHADGSLELKTKENTTSVEETLTPWFQFPTRKSQALNIIFGHWAALGGVTHTPNTFALDTGCVWGNCLTAMRLEDQQRFTVSCAP